jgi:hypothetical protein
MLFSLATLVSLCGVSVLASGLQPRQSDFESCDTLLNGCNANNTDLSNPWTNTACILYMTCENGVETISTLLHDIGATANPPRLTETVSTFFWS